MTFLEWCLQDDTDERELHVITEDGKEYLPGVPVQLLELETLKSMKVMEKPKLINNIWQVKLGGLA